jgi:hypothetical protein
VKKIKSKDSACFYERLLILRKSTNESEGKPEQKCDGFFGMVFQEASINFRSIFS